jgi:adenylate kinase family enzyme
MSAQRIQVRGITGSGKTTLSRELATRHGVRHVELDALVHGPDWREVSDDELRAALEPLLAGGGWVVDGNYTRKLGDSISQRADIVVWLDLPLRICLLRALRRTHARIRDRDELWNGNRQTWRGVLWGRNSLILWAIRAHARMRRELPSEVPPEKLMRLRSDKEARAWLSST